MSQLWERIRIARTSSGLTQEELADALGVARPTVGLWENPDPKKRSRPRNKMLHNIAEATNTPYNWLISDTSEINSLLLEQNPCLKTKELENRLKSEIMEHRQEVTNHTNSAMWERIRAARIDACLTQEEFAEKCNVSRGTVVLWESSDPKKRIIPRQKKLELISQITGAPLGWLLSDKEVIDTKWKEEHPEESSQELEKHLEESRHKMLEDVKKAASIIYSLASQSKINQEEADAVIALASLIKRNK
ncbi:helix-turn-helix domain-containing protein [Zooshikella sp. RANM57]|uniref:helix-turn-helix domain-containing protein n=1 Tax=Zooshikella sp. RANM57 TaxID=3425863 RepID=UPI003D6ED9D4